MLFYAQAFQLTRRGEALFPEKFKAWVDGPVVPQVWHRYNNDNSTLVILPADNDVPQLDDELEANVRDTVSFFSRWNSFVLSETTHNEDPWLEARRGYAAHERSSVPIPTDSIRTYYAGLLWDGEEALSKQELLDDIPERRVGSFYRAGICVRGMKRHPFYSPASAEALARPLPSEPDLPESLFAPIKRRDFVSASDL